MTDELDILFNELKLITPEMRDNEETDSNLITRICNYSSMSALSSYWNKKKKKKPIIGYGLPTNIYHPDQADEYYEALQFFRKNESFFNKKTSKMVLKLMDLFAWNTDEELEKILCSYFKTNPDNCYMYNKKDINLIKIAKLFAVEGNLSKGLKNKNEILKIDNKVASLFIELKYDIINSYKNKNIKLSKN